MRAASTWIVNKNHQNNIPKIYIRYRLGYKKLVVETFHRYIHGSRDINRNTTCFIYEHNKTLRVKMLKPAMWIWLEWMCFCFDDASFFGLLLFLVVFKKEAGFSSICFIWVHKRYVAHIAIHKGGSKITYTRNESLFIWIPVKPIFF